MPAVRLMVGAQLDPKALGILEPFLSAIKRARTSAAAEMRGLAGDIKTSMATATSSTAEAWAKAEKAAERSSRAINKAAKGAFTGVASSAEREFDRANRAHDRFVASAHASLKAVGSAALRVGSDVVKGMGVDVSVGSLIQKGFATKKAAATATLTAFQAQGKTATQGDINSTEHAVNAAADYAKVDTGKMAAGLAEFVDQASDLKTGKAILGELGDMAQVTGADVDKLGKTAGAFAKMLGDDVPDKAKATMSIMRLLAQQSAAGSIGFKDYAQYAARLAANAGKFAGSFEHNVGVLGALTQISTKGGAVDAAEATQSAGSFAAQLTKGKALKTFQKYGIRTFEDQDAQGGGTIVRDPIPMISELLQKSGGDQKMLADLVKNEATRRVISGAVNIYQGAGGGKAGIIAFQAEAAKYMQGMSKEQIDSAATLAKDQPAAKAQAFSNRLEAIATSMADRLLPALEKLAPKALQLADALSRLVSWAAENPGTAITAAIVGSIAKAGLGAAVSGSLTSAIGGGGAGGLLGGALAGLGPIIAAAIISGFIMAAAVKHDSDENIKRQKNEAAVLRQTVDAPRQAINKALQDQGINVSPMAGLSPEQARKLGGTKDESDKLEAEARAVRGGFGMGAIAPISEEQANRLKGFAGYEGPGGPGAPGGKDTLPTLENIHTAVSNSYDLLAKIEGNTAKMGPAPSTASIDTKAISWDHP